MSVGIDLWATPPALEVMRVSGVEAVTLIDRHALGDFDEVVPMRPGSQDENPEVPHSDGLAMNALAGDRADGLNLPAPPFPALPCRIMPGRMIKKNGFSAIKSAA